MYTDTTSDQEQRSLLRQLREEIIAKHRPHLQDGPGPIRVMAGIVAEIIQACQQRGITPHILREEVINRTIGDVNLRLITECVGEPGGADDYRMLADEMGIALPGEEIAGYTANGETYLWLREQMQECEKLLLSQGFDPRIYDIYGVGNTVLRQWLAEGEMGRWGFHFTAANVYPSIGAMDGIDKALRGFMFIQRQQGQQDVAVLCPEPGFGVPEWQAKTLGYHLIPYQTREDYGFKLSGAELDALLQEHPNIALIYLTVTNNPTTFGYTPAELTELHEVLARYREQGRTVYILADLAYIGTGLPEDDRARMATFLNEGTLATTIFVSSFSKSFSLTGERFGWVSCADVRLMQQISPSWSNTMASLPGEWQLRFMAYYRLIHTRPELEEKMRRFYRLRRQDLIQQLREINKVTPLFEQVYEDDDATVYNWSKLLPGVDAFVLFEKTGIAGVPGSGFGYTDQYIRFSVGVLPIRQ